LRRNSQQQEETKKDCRIALKVMGEDSSDFDDEDMAMITHKFKKFFKKTKESAKKKTSANSRTLTENSSQGVLNVVSLIT